MTSAGTYREDVFQRDLLLIQAHYWDRGYVQVKVANPLVELSPDKQSMYITINIDEGPQYRLGRVDVTGELLAPREVFLERVSVKTGRDLQPLEAVRRSAEAHRLLQGPRLRLRQRDADDAGQREDPHRRRGVRDPEGTAGHLRPHPHPRQHQDARQGDPARAAHRRGRHVHADAGSTTRSAASPRSATSRRSTCRPSAGRPTTRWTSASRSRSGRRARSRSAPASRRSRTSSPRRRSRRTTCSAAGSC